MAAASGLCWHCHTQQWPGEYQLCAPHLSRPSHLSYSPGLSAANGHTDGQTYRAQDLCPWAKKMQLISGLFSPLIPGASLLGRDHSVAWSLV